MWLSVQKTQRPFRLVRHLCLSIHHPDRNANLRITILLEKSITTSICFLVFFPFKTTTSLISEVIAFHIILISSIKITAMPLRTTTSTTNITRSDVNTEACILASSCLILLSQNQQLSENQIKKGVTLLGHVFHGIKDCRQAFFKDNSPFYQHSHGLPSSAFLAKLLSNFPKFDHSHKSVCTT